jgi:hypothetical protein
MRGHVSAVATSCGHDEDSLVAVFGKAAIDGSQHKNGGAYEGYLP